MDFKTFCEEQEIEYVITALIDGEEVARVSAYSLDSAIEDSGKLNAAIQQHLTEEWNSKAEHLKDEAEV